jgi:hypothetical protein
MMSEKLVFEKLEVVTKGIIGNPDGWRAKVPGGWLVLMKTGPATVTTTYMPDPEHKWEGV